MAKKHGKGSPTDLLTPKKFRQTVGAQTRYAYRPIMRQLGKEARASRNRRRSIGKQYHGLTKLTGAMTRASTKDYANQAKTYTGFLKTVGAQDSADASSTQEQQNSIASKYGGKPSTEGKERANAAAAQRGLSAANYGGYSQQVGANNRSYLRGLKVAQRHEGIGQKKIESQRGRQIAQDKRAALKERADFSTKTAQEVRAGERDYLIQNRAFGETKRSNLAGEAISQQNANTSRYSAKTSRMGEKRQKRENARELKGGGGKKGGRPGTPKDRQRATAIIKGTTDRSKPPYVTLVQQGVDPATARWAIHHLKQKGKKKAKKQKKQQHKWHDYNPF